MRTVAHALLASYLLLGVPHPATAADKIKIEIVEATTTIGLVPHTNPGSPERITTNCDTRLNKNTANTDCDSKVNPATGPSSSLLPETLSFEAKAIFPNSSHVKLVCFPSRWNKKCKGITPIAPPMPGSMCFLDAIAALVANAAAGSTKSCTTKNLGIYRAKYEKDALVIYAPNGKLEYQIAGSW
jgi:hypothetical protein